MYVYVFVLYEWRVHVWVCVCVCRYYYWRGNKNRKSKLLLNLPLVCNWIERIVEITFGYFGKRIKGRKHDVDLFDDLFLFLCLFWARISGFQRGFLSDLHFTLTLLPFFFSFLFFVCVCVCWDEMGRGTRQRQKVWMQREKYLIHFFSGLFFPIWVLFYSFHFVRIILFFFFNRASGFRGCPDVLSRAAHVNKVLPVFSFFFFFFFSRKSVPLNF